jgi:hypothetical protein
MIMVRFLAVKAVKRQMIAAGLKPSHIEMRRIVAEANSYFEAHREELLTDASEFIARVPSLRAMSEKEASRRTVSNNPSAIAASRTSNSKHLATGSNCTDKELIRGTT